MLYLVDPSQVEIDKQKGSRFIAFAVPLQEQAHVLTHIEQIKMNHPKAQHFCYAWRLLDGSEGFSDDGEPHGSAGMPILKPLAGRHVINILVVVVRYFGGVKLGVGGLVRAYGQACQSLLSCAMLAPYIPHTQFVFSYPYDQEGSVRSVFSKFSGLCLEFSYEDTVSVRVQLPSSELNDMLKSLNEALGGQLSWEIHSDKSE